MCERGRLLAGMDERGIVRAIWRAHCDSWRCEECRQRMARRWAWRAREHIRRGQARGQQYLFLTLTRPPAEHREEASVSARRSAAAWNATMQQFRRWARQQSRPLEYLAVAEPHASGVWHRHVVTNLRIETREYRDPRGRLMRRSDALQSVLERLGWGWVHDIEEVAHGDRVGGYIVKYALKGRAYLPSRLRLITCSRNWWAPPDRSDSALQWIVIPEFLAEMARDDVQAYVDEFLNLD